MTDASQILRQAEELARTTETWADLSNALFDPIDGLVSKAYPSRADREAFVRTEEYARVRQLLTEAMDRYGMVAGATPKRKSGRFVVRLPESLHLALEREAAAEGVSLNQLVVAKLAAQLGSLLPK